jgi:large subunit ribosomal protein L18
VKKDLRIKKHNKIRRRVVGSAEKPRLSVFRSNQFIYAQIIDDAIGKTLLFESDLKLKGVKKERGFQVGKTIAEKALKQKITEVVFDRGGFIFHGRIAEVARGAREGGLKF